MIKMVNKQRTVFLQYLLIWIAYMSQDSLLFHNNKSLFTYFGLAVCLVTLFLYKRTRDRSVLGYLLYLLCMIFFVRFLNHGGIGISIFFHWTLEILTIYLAYKLDTERFFERFVNVIAFYALFSVVCTVAYKAVPSIWHRLMPVHYLGGQNDSQMPFEGIWFLHNISTFGDKLGRNLGVFTEPGLYQIPLNTALYIVLLLRDRLSYSSKKMDIIALILILATLLTKSTTGYLGMLAVLCVAIVMSQNHFQMKILYVICVGAGVVLLDYFFNMDQSILYKVVLKKLFDSSGFNLAAGSGKWRILTIEYVWEVIKQYPLGAGYDNYNQYILDSGQHLYELVGVECIKAIAYCGIPQMIAAYAWIINKAYKNKKNRLTFLLVLFLYINTTFAQSDIFYSSLMVLILAKQRKPKMSKDVEMCLLQEKS